MFAHGEIKIFEVSYLYRAKTEVWKYN